MNNGLKEIGLDMFDKGTCTTLFVTVLGLVCARPRSASFLLLKSFPASCCTPSSPCSLRRLRSMRWVEAPMWVVYGVFVLAIHVVGMYILSKIFHWDLCMVSTASVANIGGSASAPDHCLRPMTIPLRVSVF